MTTPDPTLNPNLRSFVAAANDPATDFPIQNLPFCRFISPDEPPKIGIAIGDRVVDIDMLFHSGVFEDVSEDVADRLHHAIHMATLNLLIEDPSRPWRIIRELVQNFLLDTPPGGQQTRRLREKALVKMSDIEFDVPLLIPNYTDFYASIHHARNVGSMFRPDNPLLPNYKHIPIGYHGRSSSLVPSGTAIQRPVGQTNTDNAPSPTFGPSKRLDYELELGCIIGHGNEIGSPISIADAPNHIFGLCLLNDWSARDIQAWEYQPLGPFLAKNFASTVSPFIVTIDALDPFRIAGPSRDASDPEPLPYLRPAADWGFDITLEVLIQSEQMRARNLPALRLSRGNYRDMFWTFPQMIAHHTSGGCNLEPGDLLGSGTISGPSPDSRGCLLELSWQGNGPDGRPLPRKPVELPTGEKRAFLEDGDTVTFRAFCEREGFRRIGFGECTGTIVPART